VSHSSLNTFGNYIELLIQYMVYKALHVIDLL